MPSFTYQYAGQKKRGSFHVIGRKNREQFKVCVYDECIVIYYLVSQGQSAGIWLQKAQKGKRMWPAPLVQALGEGIDTFEPPSPRQLLSTGQPLEFEFTFRSTIYFALALRRKTNEQIIFTIQYMPEPGREQKELIEICFHKVFNQTHGIGWQEWSSAPHDRKEPALVQAVAKALEESFR